MPIPEIEQALSKFKTGDPEEAIPILTSLVELVPTYVIAYVLLAQAYEATQQEDLAVAAWERAYRVIPGSPALSAGGFAGHGLAGPIASGPVLPFGFEDLPLLPEYQDDPEPAATEPEPDLGTVDFMSMMTDFDVLDDASFTAQPSPPPKATPKAPPPQRPVAAPAVRREPSPFPVDEHEVESALYDPGDSLRAVNLIKRYKKRSVVKAVNLTVRRGEIVGLLGPNGAGKTTTFYMIVGLVRPDKGQVFLGQEAITKEPMFGRARRGIGYLAQEASVFTQMTVEDNLHAVLEYQRLNRAQRKERVEELITEFRLQTVRRSKGYMLSGGERRRTEIARALASRPDFFLLDEPFAGVDPIAVEDIQSIVSGLKKRGIGVLITDHNVHETLAITDRAYLLYEGKILKQGTAEALAADPEVRKRYLGEKFTLERYQE